MLLLVQYTIIFASVLCLVALGGCFSEHSGVINLGLEGIMVMGALGGAVTMFLLPADSSKLVIVLATTFAAILSESFIPACSLWPASTSRRTRLLSVQP